MFVRKNRNRSGSVCVQIISKNSGRYRVVETIGSAKHPEAIARLCLEAHIRLHQREFSHQLSIFVYPEELSIQNFVASLSNTQIRTIGPELVFGALFDHMGFGAVKRDGLFRHLVITRLAYPVSKLKTADYLKRYRDIGVSADKIYRFLDKLQSDYKEVVEKITFDYTRKILKGEIVVVFYDMTTLYFEAEDEDDLRKIGFSKDCVFHKPQIMLGLLVGEGGYPIGYDIFKGNTFEGHTLLPTLEKIRKRYGFKQPVVVADSAMLSRDNLENLSQARYRFIIGARIKNESDRIKQEILASAGPMKDGDSFVIRKKDKTRLVITFSRKRAHKDASNRERGLQKLRAKIRAGRLTKEHINNRGYNKFLLVEGEIKVQINEAKVAEDKLWDGLKGYITNTRLSAKEIVESYGQLWQIEEAFRISKTDLRIRPIFHQLARRIEAHVCIAFVAYAIYKELERILRMAKVPFSVKRASELTHTMYALEYVLPKSMKKENVILKMDNEQELLKNVIEQYANS